MYSSSFYQYVFSVEEHFIISCLLDIHLERSWSLIISLSWLYMQRYCQVILTEKSEIGISQINWNQCISTVVSTRNFHPENCHSLDSFSFWIVLWKPMDWCENCSTSAFFFFFLISRQANVAPTTINHLSSSLWYLICSSAHHLDHV